MLSITSYNVFSVHLSLHLKVAIILMFGQFPCRRSCQFSNIDHPPCQRRIDHDSGKIDSKGINERRRGDLEKILTTTNTRAAVFRDMIIEAGMSLTRWVRAVDSGDTPSPERIHPHSPTDMRYQHIEMRAGPQTAADGEMRQKYSR